MNKLYEIQFPNEKIAGIENMYFRGEKYIYEDNVIQLFQGGEVLFNTYFNMFSVEKWNKYTELSSLFFHFKHQGKCRLSIYNEVMQAGDFLSFAVKTYIFDNRKTEENVDLSDLLGLKGLISIKVESLGEQVCLFDMYYATKCVSKKIKLGLSICTYKRELYVHKFISNFECWAHNYPETEVFIADNAGSLQTSVNPKIHIFKNKNYGGSGGFGRCIYEIRECNEKSKKGFTHVVLMDDDIFIDFHIFEKMIAFLGFLKSEYKQYFLAGAMCSLDMPFLQYEKCSEYNGIDFRQSGADFDLRKKNIAILNEREEKFGTASAGWWCSCFSADLLTPNNFPFPCFFRGDDVEFTLRNGSKIITLNGINVWHEPFYKKYSISAENYYLMRNLLVLNSVYFPSESWRKATLLIKKRFAKAILFYDYDGAELLIRAMEDFSKGINFYIADSYNPEELNQEIMKKNHKLQSIDVLLEQYRIDDINYHVYIKKDRTKFYRILRIILLNGYLLPYCFINRFSFAHIGFGGRPISYYRARRVMVFDPFMKQGYFVEMSKRKAFFLLIKFILVYIKIKFRYEKLKFDYQNNFWKFQTQTFWERFLGAK